MEFFRKETNINFMGLRRYTVTIMGVLWVLAVVSLGMKGLNFGLDFTGGTQIEARFEKPVDPNHIRSELEEQGLKGVRVQQFGSTQDVLIRVANNAVTETNAGAEIGVETEGRKITGLVQSILKKEHENVEIRRTEYVGSEVGEQLFEQGGLAVLVSIIATMVYIAFRFEYRFAISAAVGLIHDAVIILGIFSAFSIEFDLATLASVLAVLGYSLNDTIVVFDRVRENFRKIRKGSPIEIMNLSINQTLSRTIMTSLMTLFVVLALLVFGGVTLFGFSMAFFLGIIIATVSSIYVSGALALWLGLTRADLMPKMKIEAEDRP